ncbi:MAG: hypothetical protein LUC23_02690 [Prevotellaceae bacterium]|nr:hypothetical protein [Prevotellaceae bacterium]
MEYALKIIDSTPTFKEFAIAMMDFACGPKENIIALYDMLCNYGLPADVKIEVNFMQGRDKDKLMACMSEWYSRFLMNEQNKASGNSLKIKEDIDELHLKIKAFRQSDRFKEMLDMAAKFYHLAPFNALLVSMQKRGATFVLSVNQWRKLGRRPTINGQQLIALVPFGPVQVLFDYSDTEPIEGERNLYGEGVEAVMDWWECRSGKWERLKGITGGSELWRKLKENMARYGIAYHDDMNAAGRFSGYIREYNDENLQLYVGRNQYEMVKFEAKSRFLINVNKYYPPAMKFQTVCHELAHLFCRHVYYEKSKVRDLTIKEEEFEAETVAWLVCKRLGILIPSENYLAVYAREGELPEYNLNEIMKAVTKIENMINGMVGVKSTDWYKNDSNYKSIADQAVAVYEGREKLK